MRMSGLASLVLLTLFGPGTAAAEPPIGVFKVPSLHALAQQLDVQLFPGTPGGGERAVHGMLEMLGLPAGDWLDRHQPVYVITSQSGLMGDRTGWAAVVPVADLDAALSAFGTTTEEAPEDGIYRIDRGDDTPLYLEVDRNSLAIGGSRDALASIDRARQESMAFPEGGIAFDLDLEALAPLIEGVLSAQRMVLEQQGAESVHGMMALLFDLLAVLQRNVSHVQLSLASLEKHAVLHLRLLPPAGSDLEALLGQQPKGFAKVARALSEEPALVVYAANLRLTDSVREGLQGFLQHYAEVLEQTTGSSGESGTSWIGSLFSGQGQLMEKRLRCFRGDVAGRYEIGGEQAGFRSALVAGVHRRVGCEDLVDDEIAAAAEMLGPDDEPLARVTNQALMHGGVRGARIEYDLTSLLPAETEEQDSEGFAEMFGEGGMTSFYGRADDVMLTMTGRDAEQTFVATIDRLRSGQKKGGLTSEYFAPLRAGAGIWVAMDFDPLLSYFADSEVATVKEKKPEDADPVDNRLVIGIHRDDDFLALEAAFPATFLSRLPALGLPVLSRVLSLPPEQPASQE